jgi:hypothetical protein
MTTTEYLEGHASEPTRGASQTSIGSVTEQPRTKVRVPLPATSWHGYASEGLWAEPVARNRFRLLNTPFYAKGLSAGDVITTKLEPDGYVFDSVAERSGHSTYRLVPEDNKEIAQGLMDLQRLGCTWEEGPGGLVAIDVPPESSILEVFAVLEAGTMQGMWDFEEGHVGHDIPRRRSP